MTDTAWLCLAWIILVTNFHRLLSASNSRISSRVLERSSRPPKYSFLLPVTFIFTEGVNTYRESLFIFPVTCHQDLVVNVGPTETRARSWQLSSVDPGSGSLHQQFSRGEGGTASVATRHEVSLKYNYSRGIKTNTYLCSIVVVVVRAAMVISPL